MYPQDDELIWSRENGDYITYIGPLGSRFLYSYAMQVWTMNGTPVMSTPIPKEAYVALVNSGAFDRDLTPETFLSEIE